MKVWHSVIALMKVLVSVLRHKSNHNNTAALDEELMIQTTAKILKAIDIETMKILKAEMILKVIQISDSVANRSSVLTKSCSQGQPIRTNHRKSGAKATLKMLMLLHFWANMKIKRALDLQWTIVNNLFRREKTGRVGIMLPIIANMTIMKMMVPQAHTDTKNLTRIKSRWANWWKVKRFRKFF